MSSFRFPLPLAHLAFIAVLPAGIWAPLNIAQAQQVVSQIDSVPTITTNGVASTEVVPDIATISLGVDTERPKAADAARDNALAAQAIVGEIKAQGIEARDIKTLSVTLAPVYDGIQDANGYATKRTLRGYIASTSLSVRIKEIAKGGVLAGQLMDKGANRFEGIEFDYTQKKRNTMPCAATPFATPCARPIATSTGLVLSWGRSWHPTRPPPGCRRKC